MCELNGNIPKITVIIPTYNRKELVLRAINSVLSQSYTNFELIIVDDGSADGTEMAVSKISDERINYSFQKNRGVSAARNKGITLAKGEFIAFLDSDDLWKKDKLKIQLSYLEQNKDIQICQTEEIWIKNGKRLNPKNKHKKQEGFIFEKCLSLCIVSPSAVMMKKSLFDEVGLFDENLAVCEDYDLWLRISPYYPVGLIKKNLITKYGGHEDQLSEKYWGMDLFRLYALEKLLAGNKLSKEQFKRAANEALKKTNILLLGYKKRDNPEKVTELEKKISGFNLLINQNQN